MSLYHLRINNSAQATGNLGPKVLEQLLNAGFDVTVLTRQESTSTYPSNVQVAPVDYSSIDSLTSTLKGQDAVVSTVATPDLHSQNTLVDAAVAAGVKRLIPSEFGCNTLNSKVAALPAYESRVAQQEYLATKARDSPNFSYSLVMNRVFFDWGLMVGFILDLKSRKASLYDGGDRPFSTTTLSGIGKAVAGVLRHPEKTKNRAIYVNEAVLTQRDIMKIADGIKPGNWETIVVDTVKMEQDARDGLKQPNPSPYLTYDFYKRAIWGEDFGQVFEETDNELVGLKMLSGKAVADIVRSYL